MTGSVMISIRITGELSDEIDRRAAAARMDRSTYVRTVLAAAVYGPDARLDQAHPKLALQIQGVAQGTVRISDAAPTVTAELVDDDAGGRIPVEKAAKPLGYFRLNDRAPVRPFGDPSDERDRGR